jgi:hypothetical protein
MDDYKNASLDKMKVYYFENIKLICPHDPMKILSFWYGSNCLNECKTHYLSHETGQRIKQKTKECTDLPKPQL